jgi:hypothetical protein
MSRVDSRLQLKTLEVAERATHRSESRVCHSDLRDMIALFLGVRRGADNRVFYDDTGVFIKNKWGRNTIKLYVDSDNKPHFEAYDPLGKSMVYELKVPKL